METCFVKRYTHTEEVIREIVGVSRVSDTNVWYEYKIKFGTKLSNPDNQGFLDYVESLGGEYNWCDDTYSQLGVLPEGYNCWCDLMYEYLSTQGYKLDIKIGESQHKYIKHGGLPKKNDR